MSKETATVVEEKMTDHSIAYNVEYRDARGYLLFTVGCVWKDEAESLAQSLNDAAWVYVEDHSMRGSS